MKKIILYFLSVFLLFLSFSTNKSIAYLSSSQKDMLKDVFTQIIKPRDRYSNSNKVKKYNIFRDFMLSYKSKVDLEKKEIIDYFVELLDGKLSQLQNNTISTYQIPGVDMEQVKSAWLSWHNQERNKKGLHSYKWSTELEKTARSRALYLASINQSTHRRNPGDSYYDFNKIKNRFKSKGVEFNLENGSMFTENIAYQYYNCNSSDCTDQLISAIRKGFDFFMSEASYNGAHYRGVMHRHFKIIGAGIAVVGKRYYIVTHYGTSLK